MWKIRKKFKFEMAHILNKSYSKECQNIHGHSYVLEVIITAIGLNVDGMVIDFKKLKEIVNEKIINKFDHILVLCPDVGGSIPSIIDMYDLKVVFVKYNPTAENMAKDFYDILFREISVEVKGLVKLQIRLHETDTGYSEYGGADV